MYPYTDREAGTPHSAPETPGGASWYALEVSLALSDGRPHRHNPPLLYESRLMYDESLMLSIQRVLSIALRAA
jgi:hypothetical protein